MKKRLLIDLTVVIIIPLLVFLAVFLLGWQINYFTSLLLIFGVPSLYLSLRSGERVGKVALFSLFVSIPLALISELIAFGEKAWSVPKSLFSFRLFGFSPIENYIWMFLVTYLVLIFYEHFYDKYFQKKMSKRINIMNYIMYTATLLILIVFIVKPFYLIIPYSYIWLGTILLLIPSIIFLIKYSKFFWNFFKVSLFFFYTHLIFELIGVKLSHWTYPGLNYIGMISILGIKFPFEEFFFVFIVGGFAALSYYEFFTNKKLK